MSRSIKDSTDLLKTSLTEIGTALTNKNIEGGGIENLKVSQVAGLIDQIQAGSGGVDISDSYYSNKCILLIELSDIYGADWFRATPTPELEIDSDSVTRDIGSTHFVLCIYKLQSNPQTITIDGQFTDGDSPDSFVRTVKDVDLSKAGLFYYRAK